MKFDAAKLWVLINVIWIVIAILLLVNTSSVDPSKPKTANDIVAKQTDYYLHYSISSIDGCEYIHYGHGFTHKGNCTNTFHKNEKD